MSFTDKLLLAGAVVITILFVLFWVAPGRTARTVALMVSTLRHVIRLKKEAKGEPVMIEERRRPSRKTMMGTISAYLGKGK